MLDLSQIELEFSGNIVSKDDPDYDEARSVYNANIQRSPDVIAMCKNEADVVAAVKFAKDANIPIAVRCAGHNGSGHSVCDNGVVIDLSEINYTRMDIKNNTVRVGAGCNWEEVDKATSSFGKSVPSGVVSSTGVSGLTLGGGHGYITRKYGLTIDNLVEVDVVLADGSFITASESQNSDLFWGIRGGGGNFGIVTSFLFKLAPVQEVYCGLMIWDLEDLQKSFGWYDNFMKNAREDIYGFYAIGTVPPAAPFPEELHLNKFGGVMWCYYGPKEEFEEAFEPIRNFARETPPMMDGTHWGTLADLNAAFNALYPAGEQWYWKGDYFEDITEEVINIHAKNAEKLPSWKSTMHLYPMNGAVHRVDQSATAWNDRSSTYSMVIAGVDSDPGNFNALKEWASNYWKELNPHSSLSGGYVNFWMDDEGSDRIKTTYGNNYEKLVDLKRKFDPENIFQFNHNIKP